MAKPGAVAYLGIPLKLCFRPLVLPVIVGMCLGVTLNIMFVPFFEDFCDPMIWNNEGQQNLVKLRETKSVDEKTQDKVSSPPEKSDENFEPRLVPPKPRPKDQQAQPVKKVIRPRYISTELGIREKLLVAVITSDFSLNTFGVAVNKTLSPFVTKTVMFTSDKTRALPPGISVVSFNDKHTQLLPIHILRYLSEHYAQTYDYYMFVSDRSYLRAEKVYDLVSHISISEAIHMGAPGEDNYCSLQGGVLVSQLVMSQVLADLEWCMKNTHPTDPSVTLGRCIHHASQLPCSDKGGGQLYQYHKVSDFDYDDDITTLREDANFNHSLSVFPMPDDISHYKMHRYFCLLELNVTRQEIEKTRKSIVNLSHFAPGGEDSLTWPIGLHEQFKPKSRFDVIRWVYFNETCIYFDTEVSNLREMSGIEKEDVQDIIKTAVQQIVQKYKYRYKFLSLQNGYRRFDPVRGMEYTLDLMVKDSEETGKSVLKRVHMVRPLGRVEIIPVPYVTENSRIHLILPVMVGEKEEFLMFMETFAKSCLDSVDNTHLHVVFIYPERHKLGSKDPFTAFKTTISFYENKYNIGPKLSWKALESNRTRLSHFAIMDTMVQDFQPDTLILLCSVGMELSVEYLNRVRMNTIRGWQVFFPIPFWQYKPNLVYDKKYFPGVVEISQKYGHFDVNSYEHSSFHVADYLSARKLLSPGERFSRDLLNMFLKYQKLHVFRAVEPALKHRWKNVSCNVKDPENVYAQCQKRLTEGLASRSQLATLIFEETKQIIKPPFQNPSPTPGPNLVPPLKET